MRHPHLITVNLIHLSSFFTDTLLDSFALGSAEWYCHTHWQSWFKYCSTCFHRPGHQVQCFLLVFQVAEANIW
jgi:hypothetical protein